MERGLSILRAEWLPYSLYPAGMRKEPPSGKDGSWIS